MAKPYIERQKNTTSLDPCGGYSDQKSSTFSPISLSDCLNQKLEQYLADLGENNPVTGLYDLVIQEVEKELIDCLFDYFGPNQSKVAVILGISRTSLRKKMATYGTYTRIDQLKRKKTL